jgi:hypothetical protein
MQNITPPAHPLPPGGHMPDLNLAGSDGFNVASDQSIQSQPDPAKPVPYVPVLSGSPDLGGIDPAMPVPMLNLAGVEGVPTPAQLARPTTDNTIHQPDFGLPDFTQPELQPQGTATSGISFEHQAAFSADPMLPDLTEYHRPYGLDIHNLNDDGNAIFRPDPLLSGLLDYEVPSGATISHDPLASDPLVPDLQQPQMALDVEMQERPGDLDPDALQQLHIQPLYQQLGGIPYNQVFMNQSGMNSRQRRHNDLLMGGLDSI